MGPETWNTTNENTDVKVRTGTGRDVGRRPDVGMTNGLASRPRPYETGARGTPRRSLPAGRSDVFGGAGRQSARSKSQRPRRETGSDHRGVERVLQDTGDVGMAADALRAILPVEHGFEVVGGVAPGLLRPLEVRAECIPVLRVGDLDDSPGTLPG